MLLKLQASQFRLDCSGVTHVHTRVVPTWINVLLHKIQTVQEITQLTGWTVSSVTQRRITLKTLTQSIEVFTLDVLGDPSTPG